MQRIYYIILSVIVLSTTVSCNDYLDIDPSGKVIPETTEDYRQLLTSAYVVYPQHKSLTALRTDELILSTAEGSNFSALKDIYAYNDQSSDPVTKQFPYGAFYKAIFYANQTLNEGVKTMKDGTEKQQLLAEAHALRALAYFDLVNLLAKPYQAETAAQTDGVPLVLSMNIEDERPKEKLAVIYNQIHTDIEAAKELVQVETYAAGKNYRFSKVAILALEARVNLYQEDYQAALESAEQALAIKSELVDLNATPDVLPTDYTSVESILALEETMTSSLQASTFASDELLAAFDQTGDLRFPIWFSENSDGTYTVIKVGETALKVTFRTAELYFIKAEALAQLHRVSAAVDAITPFVESRYTPTAAAALIQEIGQADQAEFITFILEERFREFALEGQRWFDLRRLNQKKIVHKIYDDEYILQQNDARYTLQFPLDARLQNPNLSK